MRRVSCALALAALAACSSKKDQRPQATIIAVRIGPAVVMVAPRGTASVRALARAANGAEVDVTSAATWSSDAAGVATVASGVVTGVSSGVAHLSAAYSGGTGTASAVVEQLVALGLSSSATESVGAGFSGEIHAFGLYSEGYVREVTEFATWKSDAPPYVEVSNAFGSKGAVHALATGTAKVSASYGGLTAETTFTVTSRQVLSVTIGAVPWPLPVGVSQQLRATAMYNDFTSEDVTATASWSPSSAAVSVSAGGLATAAWAGTAVVTASYGGCSARSLLTVVGDAPTSLVVTLGASTLWQGSHTSATAKLLYPDGLMWDVSEAAALSSTDTAVATIGASQGVLALTPGTTSIQASYAGLLGSAALTVDAITALSIVAPAEIPQGATVSASASTAHVVPSSGSLSVTSSAEWASSDTSVLTVTNAAPSKGRLTGVAPGTATITVQLAGFTATQTITVRGRVLSIAVTPENGQVVEKSVLPLTATATLEGGTLDVTSMASWSSDLEAAYVTGRYAYGLRPGTSVVTAELGGAAGYALVTVLPLPPLKVEIRPFLPDPVRLPVGATVRFSAYVQNQDYTMRNPGSGVTWSSTDPTVASFSADSLHAGELTVLATGTTDIAAQYAGISSSDWSTRTVIGDVLSSVSAPATATAEAGGSVALPLTATFVGGTSDVSPFVTWTTTDADVAIVDGGQILGMRPGTATVQTTLPSALGGNTLSTTVTVMAPTVTAVTVDAPATLAVGGQGPLHAIANLSNGDFLAVTDVAALTTTTPALLSIAGTAVKALAVGSGTVQADYLAKTGTYTVSVVAGVPWLLISPSGVRAAVGQTMCPYVTTSVGSAVSNVTQLAAYATSDSSVVPPLSGACTTAAAIGTSLVTASYGGKSAGMLVVVERVRDAPQVVPLSGKDAPIHVFERVGYEASASPQTEPVTTAATWMSGDLGIAKAAGGIVEGVAQGWTTVTVSIGGPAPDPYFSTSFWVRVLPATLDAIELPRWAIAVPAGASYPLTVTGTYSDGVSGVDVTGAVTFSSADAAVAAFDGSVPGLLHAKVAGVTHVTAHVGAKTATIPVTVF